MSCFHKDVSISIKDPQIGYIYITTTRLFEYLYDEYREKTKKLQNKALPDMEEEVDCTCQLITPYRFKQEKLLQFLLDTEQAVSVGRYIVIFIRVIE